ncbi:glycosyltransferase [Allochromatium palmeri]|uniref:Glycosyltransferase n=1 Tax=Allochromatium palmeri TaxID=231048 RepID=A0A6N8EKE4_9GAMM|nr:glycosyltransferase [Allochromatium palmeri]MTW23017.1 glycosyltransferase [Allochromatium palmeri]
MRRIALVYGQGIGPRILGSDQRLVATMTALLDHQCVLDIFLISTDRSPGIEHLLARRPTFRDRLAFRGSVQALGPGAGYDAVYLTSIWGRRLEDAVRCVEQLAPRLPLVVDTADCLAESVRQLHPVRFEGMRKWEQALHRRAELSVFVTQAECFKACARLGLDASRVMEVGYAFGQDLPAQTRGFDERRHMAFLGGAVNPHNINALRNFVHTIIPEIARADPAIELHIIGAGMDQFRLADPKGRHRNIRILGYVENLLETLSRYRNVVVPLLSGGGMKIKIVDALMAGTPVVTSIAGVEGMPLTHREHVLIAETPEQFVEGVCELSQDRRLWNALSQSGFLQATKYYNYENLSRQVGVLLERLPASRLD